MLLKEGTRVVNEELSIEVAAVVNVLAQARLVGCSRIALPVVCLCRLLPGLVVVVHDTVAGERLQGKSLHPWHLPDQVEVTTYRTDLFLIVTAITADVNEWVIGSTAVNLSVLVVSRLPRALVLDVRPYIVISTTRSCCWFLGIHDVSIYTRLYLQTNLLEVSLHIGTEVVALHVIGVGAIDRLLVVVTQTSVDLHYIITTCNREIVAHFRSESTHTYVLPIYIRMTLWIRTVAEEFQFFLRVLRGTSVIFQTAVQIGSCCVRIYLILQVGWLRECVVEAIVNIQLACSTLLGSYHDDTVGCSSTVDSGSRSILQYSYLVDIICIQVLEVTLLTDNVIDNVERCATTTDTDRCLGIDTTT